MMIAEQALLRGKRSFSAAHGNPTIVVIDRFQNIVSIQSGGWLNGDVQAIVWHRLDDGKLRSVRLPGELVKTSCTFQAFQITLFVGLPDILFWRIKHGFKLEDGQSGKVL